MLIKNKSTIKYEVVVMTQLKEIGWNTFLHSTNEEQPWWILKCLKVGFNPLSHTGMPQKAFQKHGSEPLIALCQTLNLYESYPRTGVNFIRVRGEWQLARRGSQVSSGVAIYCKVRRDDVFSNQKFQDVIMIENNITKMWWRYDFYIICLSWLNLRDLLAKRD